MYLSGIWEGVGETLNETKNQKETWKWKTPFGKLKTQKLA